MLRLIFSTDIVRLFLLSTIWFPDITFSGVASIGSYPRRSLVGPSSYTSEILGCLDPLLLGFARPGYSSLSEGNFISVVTFLGSYVAEMTFTYLQVAYHISLLDIIIVFVILFAILDNPFLAPGQAVPALLWDASPASVESIALQFELGEESGARRWIAIGAERLRAVHFVNHHRVVG